MHNDRTGAGGTGVGGALELRRRQFQRHDRLGNSDNALCRLGLHRGATDSDTNADANQRRYKNANANSDASMFAGDVGGYLHSEQHDTLLQYRADAANGATVQRPRRLYHAQSQGAIRLSRRHQQRQHRVESVREQPSKFYRATGLCRQRHVCRAATDELGRMRLF